MRGNTLWLFFCFILLMAASACVRTHCNGVVCANGGVCVNGKCNCATGYEGANCQTAWNEKFTGTWQVTDTLIDTTTQFFSTYQIHVYSNGVGGGFYIDKIRGYVDSIIMAKSDSLNGAVSGPQTFTFTPAYSKDSSFYLSSGNGYLYATGKVGASMRFTVSGKSYSLYTGWVKQ